jgi:plasmid replication initiation protein
MRIKKDYLVEKRNILNEVRANNMSLQELRFFSIYLAKINSRDINTRLVRFTLGNFQKIMELGRLNINHIRNSIDSLLGKVVGLPREDGGLDRFQLFKKATIAPDESGEWYVEINAHDDALPLMFDFKEKYFTYELWNALRLKSTNQLRMYEVLKQYEWIGEKTFSLVDLRKALWIGEKEYTRFGDFRTDVLEVCKKALEEHTDIKFTYEPTGKLGRGGKVQSLKFTISKNEAYTDQLSLNDFIDPQTEAETIVGEAIEIEATEMVEFDGSTDVGDEAGYFEREIYPFLAEACGNEFGLEEIQVLYNLAVKIVPKKAGKEKLLVDVYGYLKHKHDELKWRAKMMEIKSRMGYIKAIIEADLAG